MIKKVKNTSIVTNTGVHGRTNTVRLILYNVGYNLITSVIIRLILTTILTLLNL